MDFMDFLNQIFGQVTPQESDDKKYESLKPMYTPSVAEVIDIREAVNHFSSLGTFVAKHNAFCREPNCGYNFGPARFADVQMFLAVIKDRLGDLKNATEASDLVQLWMTRDVKDIEMDPRYIAFRASHDLLMVVVYSTKVSLNDPFQFTK